MISILHEKDFLQKVFQTVAERFEWFKRHSLLSQFWPKLTTPLAFCSYFLLVQLHIIKIVHHFSWISLLYIDDGVFMCYYISHYIINSIYRLRLLVITISCRNYKSCKILFFNDLSWHLFLVHVNVHHDSVETTTSMAVATLRLVILTYSIVWFVFFLL